MLLIHVYKHWQPVNFCRDLCRVERKRRESRDYEKNSECLSELDEPVRANFNMPKTVHYNLIVIHQLLSRKSQLPHRIISSKIPLHFPSLYCTFQLSYLVDGRILFSYAISMYLIQVLCSSLHFHFNHYKNLV